MISRRVKKLTTTVSLSAERESNRVSRDTNTAAGAATAGIDSQVVSAANLATTAGVALGVVVGAHISPLAERGLSEQDGAGLAELLDDVGVAGHDVAEKGPATGRGLHVVLGGDVVLDGEGDAVERTADLALASLGITLGGNGKDVGVELQDGAGEVLVNTTSGN